MFCTYDSCNFSYLVLEQVLGLQCRSQEFEMGGAKVLGEGSMR